MNNNMNTAVRKEIEDFIVSGRRKTEEEFDHMLDEFFQNKTEKDKDEIGVALSDFFSDRFNKFIEVDNKLAQIGRSKELKKSIGILEMAEC